MARQYRYARYRRLRDGTLIESHRGGGYVEAGNINSALLAAKRVRAPGRSTVKKGTTEVLLVASPDGAEVALLESRRTADGKGGWGRWRDIYG